ncbi:methyltransferase domain-containing protein [Cohnella sp. CFH 77786]|uniref:class I SAM-dependent methyltransferase n=1 Tax=Cohnella sp. CFH 77786 TaxID=2662265 RepID=UPI001C608FCC|nr:class I SAM-dependent methyltransferase [Cohnella sp. CFH 77786]MBW5447016.1 methyltransferase domain-containing protein [Cohnella sp. CFH 77786]
MGFLSVLTMAQRWVAERARPGDAVVDATAGGGVDTLFLARTVGSKGTVYAFDIQEEALERTRRRLAEASGAEPLARVQLYHAGHERMAELLPSSARGRLRAAMFNLGYLPGADASVITKPDTTLAALEAALSLLAPGGVLTAVLYPGHPGGDAEAAAVERWAAGIHSSLAQTVLYRYPQKPNAPYLVALENR